MLNTPELREQYRKERHILGLLPSNVHKNDLFSANVLLWSMGLAALMLIGGCITAKPAHAEVSDEQAVRVIVGEAANQGKIGMICVAEVLRVRGSTRGFYGPTKKHLKQAPEYVWKMARKAWFASKTTRYTKGADHFENINAFGCPSWVKDCIETFRYKDHVFYKEVV